mmetsp:Transcript_11795/g.36696  ORF Transcript_11795/g.36696 Transcript_11795/m.36696 type:complete len:279 (-) Transcript_11795:2133-2969(-)
MTPRSAGATRRLMSMIATAAMYTAVMTIMPMPRRSSTSSSFLSEKRYAWRKIMPNWWQRPASSISEIHTLLYGLVNSANTAYADVPTRMPTSCPKLLGDNSTAGSTAPNLSTIMIGAKTMRSFCSTSYMTKRSDLSTWRNSDHAPSSTRSSFGRCRCCRRVHCVLGTKARFTSDEWRHTCALTGCNSASSSSVSFPRAAEGDPGGDGDGRSPGDSIERAGEGEPTVVSDMLSWCGDAASRAAAASASARSNGASLRVSLRTRRRAAARSAASTASSGV